MHTQYTAIKGAIEAIASEQAISTSRWHQHEPEAVDSTADHTYENIVQLALAQHLSNFKLWHVEDTARRTDVPDKVIARCKRTIDGLNQQRNDQIEQVDNCLVALMALPAQAADIYNTETAGMAIDRLSILALKVFHMQEQVMRDDVTEDHRRSCSNKLAILQRQRKDLLQSLLHLIDEYAAGTKRPMLYRQFKMYNDPALNPELYTNTK